MNENLQGQDLSRHNNWRSPAYITREIKHYQMLNKINAVFYFGVIFFVYVNIYFHFVNTVILYLLQTAGYLKHSFAEFLPVFMTCYARVSGRGGVNVVTREFSKAQTRPENSTVRFLYQNAERQNAYQFSLSARRQKVGQIDGCALWAYTSA